MKTHTEILLEGNRFLRRTVTEEDLGDQSKFLIKAVSSMFEPFGEMFEIPNPVHSEFPQTAPSYPVRFYRNSSQIVLAMDLDFLPLFTTYSLATSTGAAGKAEAYLRTAFHELREAYMEEVYMRLVWPMKPFEKMTFGVILRPNTGRTTAPRFSLMEEFLIYQTECYQGGQRAPLCLSPFNWYPNVHDTGKVCMGGGNAREIEEAASKPSIGSCFQAFFQLFLDSPMNNHLLREIGRNPYRFDPTTLAPWTITQLLKNAGHSTGQNKEENLGLADYLTFYWSFRNITDTSKYFAFLK